MKPIRPYSVQPPSDDELWAIELEGDVLDAELRLVDAEAELAAEPRSSSVAEYLRALLDVVDLHDFTSNRSPALHAETLGVGL